MSDQVLQIGERLNERVALQLAADLSLNDTTDDYCVDFSRTQHFEPFGMLLASSAINRFRNRLSLSSRQLNIRCGDSDEEGLAAHMGFWQSIGIPLGRAVNAQAHSDSYLPITRIGVDEIYRESGGLDPLASGIIEQRAAQLAIILARPRSESLVDALTYSIRELIRNVLEHARTPAIWLAGMSWPKRNYVQVAVLDEGVGIRKSLATNALFQYDTDALALRAALQPGVSRNLGQQPTRQKLETWEEQRQAQPLQFFANAGYGLFMISSLCREAGQFLIASGNSALAYVGSGEVSSATGHHGTALRLVIQPSEVKTAMDSIFSGNLARGPAGHRPMISPSTLKRLGLDSLTGEGGPAMDEPQFDKNDPGPSTAS